MTNSINEGKSEETLLEQYKLYVQSAENVTTRRGQTNSFFVSVLSGVLALLSIAVGRDMITGLNTVVLLMVALLGLVLCFLWFVNIRSYRSLNSAKFTVIHEMEQRLSFACYDREWQVLAAGKKRTRYLHLTQVELYIPVALAIPYLLLLAHSLFTWLRTS